MSNYFSTGLILGAILASHLITRNNYNQIRRKLKLMSNTLDDLLQNVQDESTVDDSIILLLTNIKAQLDALLGGALTPDQQAKVDAIFAGIQANKQKVADAIIANTPAGGTPTPTDAAQG